METLDLYDVFGPSSCITEGGEDEEAFERVSYRDEQFTYRCATRLIDSLSVVDERGRRRGSRTGQGQGAKAESSSREKPPRASAEATTGRFASVHERAHRKTNRFCFLRKTGFFLFGFWKKPGSKHSEPTRRPPNSKHSKPTRRPPCSKHSEQKRLADLDARDKKLAEQPDHCQAWRRSIKERQAAFKKVTCIG